MINKTPLIDLWLNSIISDVVSRLGTTLPLQVGQDAPHPSPDPVALTIAPARIERIEVTRPAVARVCNFIKDYQ